MDGWTIGLSVLLLAVGRVGIFFRRQRATFRFDTYHTICPKCWFGHRTEVRTLAIVGLTCGTAAAVGVGLWLTTLLIHTHTEPDYVCLLVGVPAGLVAGLVGLYVVGKVLGAFLGTPRKLRYMRGGVNGFACAVAGALRGDCGDGRAAINPDQFVRNCRNPCFGFLKALCCGFRGRAC